MKKSITKVMLVIAMFMGAVITLPNLGFKTVNEAHAAVTETQVVEYLEENGMVVHSAQPKPGTASDWIAHTSIGSTHYWTTVFVTGNNINGHENVGM